MARGQSEALASTLRALAGVVAGGAIAQAAAALPWLAFPWLAFLSPRDQAACLRELSAVASATVATGQLRRLEETLSQWEATGLAAWDDQPCGRGRTTTPTRATSRCRLPGRRPE